jgi:hypothetical protein
MNADDHLRVKRGTSLNKTAPAKVQAPAAIEVPHLSYRQCHAFELPAKTQQTSRQSAPCYLERKSVLSNIVDELM